MTNFVTTKRALLTSVLSLVLCFAMLLGTTFAWFTDTVTSSGNVIQTGNLKVKMEWEEGNVALDVADWKDASAGPIFNNKTWEPGRIEAKHIKITNVGTLALKYELNIVPHGTVSELADVIDVYYFADATQLDRSTTTGGNRLGTLAELLDNNVDNDNHISKLINGRLDENGDYDDFTIALKMQETAGNEYQGLSIGSSFSIQLLATQATYEDDSFDNTYDADATYPVVGFGSSNAVGGMYEIDLLSPKGGKVGSVELPVAAIDNNGEEAYASVVESGLPSVTVGANQDARVFNINIVDLVENNTDNIKVHLNVGKGLTGVSVYSGTTPINIDSYSPHDGVLIFTATDVSKITMVYDAVPGEIPAPPSAPSGIPVAVVTYESAYINTTLPWEDFGEFTPNTNVDPNPQLEATFQFVAPHDENTVNDCAYKDWYCDYVVSLDRDLGENQILLGGNYGEWGWIGFHNGDITLEAGDEIYLLGSVTQNPWTYESIAGFVGTFICGVGDVNDALDGATFTVKLRLTNPENEEEMYDVNTVTYTFGTNGVIVMENIYGSHQEITQ